MVKIMLIFAINLNVTPKQKFKNLLCGPLPLQHAESLPTKSAWMLALLIKQLFQTMEVFRKVPKFLFQ